MKLTRNCCGSAIVVLFAGIALAGCTNPKQSVAPAPAASDPAVSFERIVENLRHYLDQLQVAPITEMENGAFSDFRVSREVIGHESTPPADAQGEHRGTITVAIRWSHSFRPSPEQPTEKPDEQRDSKKAQQEQSAEDAIRDGIQVLDSDVIADLKPVKSKISSAISPHAIGKNDSEEELRKFQFVFRNQRWEQAEEPIAEADPPPEGEAPAQGETSANGETEPDDAGRAPSSKYESLDDAVVRALKLQ